MRLSVVFLVMAGLLCLVALSGVAGAVPASFSYEKDHIIVGSTDCDLGGAGGYQVNITFYNTTGSDSGNSIYLGSHISQSLFQDLRINGSYANGTDDGVQFSIWNQTASYTANSVIVWVNITDTIPKGGQLILKVYYSNPSAVSVFNGSSTFPFFDDFNGDLSKWTRGYSGGSSVISNGILTVTGGASAWEEEHTTVTYGVNTSLLYRFMVNSEANYWQCGYGPFASAGTDCAVVMYNAGKSYNFNKAGTADTPSRTSTLTSYTNVEIYRRGSAAIPVYEGGSLKTTETTRVSTVAMSPFFAAYASKVLSIDWVLVRTAAINEPTHGATGTENNTVLPPVAAFSSNVSVGIVPFTVQFTDTSSYFPLWYNWSFGDGSGNSTLQNPSHVYNAVGSYTVIETVSNANGTASASRSISACYFNYTKVVPVVGSPDGAIWEQKQLIIHAGSGTDGSPSAGDVYLNGHSLNFPLDIGLFNANGSAPVPYMFVKYNASTAFLWFLAQIPAAPGNFYLMLDYGESGYSGTQLPYQVWRFYEPFSSGSMPDAANWTTGGSGGSSISNGKLIVSGSGGWGYAYTRSTYGPGTMIVSNTILTDNVPNGFYGSELCFRIGQSFPLIDIALTPSVNAIRTYNTGLTSASSNIDPGVAHDYTIKWSSSAVRFYIDNSEMTGSPIISNLPGSALPVCYESMDSTAPCTADYLMVGNCTTNEPYFGAWGSESNPSIAPVADFSSSPNPVQLGSSVQFSDASTGGVPSSWAWSFGDGSGNSTLQNPSHVYNAVGSYTVIETVSNVYGSSSKSKTVTVSSWVPVAGFSYQVQGASAPFSVQFSDASTGGVPSSWAWSFGDGSSNSTVQYPVHVYSVVGNYSVILTVSNANGSSSILRYVPVVEGQVYVKQGTVLSASQAWENGNTYEPTVFYDSNPVIFTNLTHVYKMWYTGGFGDWNINGIGYAESTDGLTWTKYGRLFTNFARDTVLKVGSVYYMYASFEDLRIDRFTSMDGVHWTDTGTAIVRGSGYDSQYVANCYVWIDSDGLWKIMYDCASNGLWSIGLAQSPDGITWTKNATNPVLTNSPGTVGAADYVQYVNGVYRMWTLSASSGNLPTDIHLYTSSNLLSWSAASGNSSQILRSTADEGAGSSIGQVADPDVYNNSGVEYFYYAASTDGNNPSGQQHIKLAVNVTQSYLYGSANFSANVTAGSSPLGIQFTDTSGGAPIGWDWSFGDGSGNSTVQNPVHVYAGGSFTVIETVYYAGGVRSTSVKLNYINVVAPSAPVANFTANASAGFNPLAVQFTDTSTGGAPTGWAWSFGDGTANSTLQNPSHVYSVMGNYTAVLTVSNGGGSSVKTMLIQVMQYPVAAFSMTLSSGTAQLTDAFTDGSSAATSWAWSFGDGSANSSAQSPQHTFNVGGSFTVTLTASNIYGSNSVQHTVTVSQASSGYYIRLRASAPVQYYPLTGILVTVTDPSGALVNQASTDSNGNTNIYVGPFPAPGTYHVNLHRSDLQDQTLTFDPSSIPPYLIDMPVIMQGSSGANYFYVSGSVTRASDGHPLDMVSVYVYYPNGSLAGSQNTGTAPLSSGQYNIGVLQNPPTGDYTVRVLSQSFENQTKTFSYYGGYTFSVNFQLAYSGSYNVKGYVRDINGQPITSAFVTVSENGLNTGSSVDGTGYYLTAPGFLSPGQVTVTADAQGYTEIVKTLTFPGDFDQSGVNWTNFVLQLAPVTPTPTVTPLTGYAINLNINVYGGGDTHGIYYFLRDPNGATLDGVYPGQRISILFGLTRAAPSGYYSLNLSKPGLAPALVNIKLPDDFTYNSVDGLYEFNGDYLMYPEGDIYPSVSPGPTSPPPAYVSLSPDQRAQANSEALGVGIGILPALGAAFILCLLMTAIGMMKWKW